MAAFTGSVSVHAKFAWKWDEDRIRAGDEGKSKSERPNSRDFAIDMLNLNTTPIL